MNRLIFLDMKQSEQWISPIQRESLIQIINISFANINATEYVAKTFDSNEPYERKLRLYLDNNRVVGYCLLTFTSIANSTVIKASAAFLPEHRKGGNTFQFSLKESFKSWLKKPWCKHYYAGAMISPAMYRATAKNTAIIWPHSNQKAPTELFDYFNPDGMSSNDGSLRCLVSVGLSSNYSNAELDTLRNSNKPEIKYYCEINPDFDQGVALFVIIPVNFSQLILTLVKMLKAI